MASAHGDAVGGDAGRYRKDISVDSNAYCIKGVPATPTVWSLIILEMIQTAERYCLRSGKSRVAVCCRWQPGGCRSAHRRSPQPL